MRTCRRLIEALGPTAARLGLRKGASETSLVAAETLMNAKLPSDYRAWLAISDGQEIESLSILPTGGWLVSVDRLLEQWTYERQFDLEDYEIPHTQDRDRIRSFVFHPRRITIGGAQFLDYDNTVLDLVPGPAGTEGQLIDFVSESDFTVVAPSFDAYLDRIAELVETKQLVVGTNDEDHLALVAPDQGDRWYSLLVPTKSRTKAKKS